MIWVVSTDSTHCRIYAYQKQSNSLQLLKDINHAELRLKKKEFLTTDRVGHYQTKDTTRGAYDPHIDPKEVEVIKFSKEIALILNQGRKKQLYKKLIIVAGPHINGLILQHIDNNTRKDIAMNIKKDYLHMTDEELLKYLNEHVFDYQN